MTSVSILLTLQSVLCFLSVSVMSHCISEGVVVDLPEQEEECQLSVSGLPSQ